MQPPTVTNRMIAAGWDQVCKLKPMIEDFVDEGEAAAIMNAAFKAMWNAAPYAQAATPAPVPASAPASPVSPAPKAS